MKDCFYDLKNENCLEPEEISFEIEGFNVNSGNVLKIDELLKPITINFSPLEKSIPR